MLMSEMMSTASERTKTMTLLLSMIASISMIVGGIGIMNIMLVSVVERTREIGIRRAVGAKRADILTQFLAEAIMICALGAGLGVLIGLQACALAAEQSQWPMAVTPDAVGMSCGFAVAVGVFFGFYPAFRAAKLLPIDALRYD